jgi:hypothetical protein
VAALANDSAETLLDPEHRGGESVAMQLSRCPYPTQPSSVKVTLATAPYLFA